jgi:hypothetical protein
MFEKSSIIVILNTFLLWITILFPLSISTNFKIEKEEWGKIKTYHFPALEGFLCQNDCQTFFSDLL